MKAFHKHARATVTVTAHVYEEICKGYTYVEHTCTFMYAVNSFTVFEIGKRMADACLILLLMILLTTHFLRKETKKLRGLPR